MTWLDELRAELARAGIGGATKRRIVAELNDHLACDPSAETRLGAPREVAERFVAELRLVRTRRAATRSFAALAFAALALGVNARLLQVAGGWPDIGGLRATIVSIGGLAIVLAAQVAFVTGVLAFSRRPHDAAAARLVQRRIDISLLAGVVVVAGELVQAIALRPMLPPWWFAAALALGSATLVALAGSRALLGGARALTPNIPTQDGGIAADLPAPLRRYADMIPALTGLTVVALMAGGSAIAEHSVAEGVTRGVIEGIAFAGCFALLGRPLGIRRHSRARRRT